MSDAYKIIDQSAIYFVTFRVVGFIDIFNDRVSRDIFIDTLRFCQKEKGLQLYSFVIMSNHVHLIAQRRDKRFSELVRDIKKFSSYQIIEELKKKESEKNKWILEKFSLHAKLSERHRHFQLWSRDNHAEIIFSKDFFMQKLNYIHNNPVKAGIVHLPEHYIYSSASFHKEGNGLLEIEPFAEQA